MTTARDPMPTPTRRQQLLVINPNTSESVSALIHPLVQQAAGPQVQVRTVTARFGGNYISSQAAYAVATHATLDAWAHACDSAADQPAFAPDAVLIACFGDPGLLALREISAAPVTGLAEAAMLQASRRGKFGIVTGGSRWQPMLATLAQTTGMHQLQAIHTVALTGGQMAADPQGAVAVLRQACLDMLARHDVKSIIFGGAGLAGQARQLSACVPVPLIDCVLAGTEHALSLIGSQTQPPDWQAHGALPDTQWQQLPGALTQALQRAQVHSLG